MKLLLTDKAFQDALCKVGDSWEVSAKDFTTTMNGRGMYKSVNAARVGKSAQGKVWWHRWSQKALQQHIRRTNYQTCIWKVADIPRPRAPSVADGHGWTAVHGKMQPLWFSGQLIPTCIALVDDRLASGDDDDDEDDDDDDDSDGEKSDSEGDLAFDEYTVSESESDVE